MFTRFLEGAIGKRLARRLAHFWKGRALQRARWATGILAFLLIAMGTIVLARRGTVSAANEEASSSDHRGAIQAIALPAAGAAARPSDKALAPMATPDTSSLRTIGTLTAAHFFQTYLNISLIAEGKAKGTYTNEDAHKVLCSVLSLVDSVDQQLESLGQRTLDPEDRASLQQMRAISELLRRQGAELQTCWDSGQDQDTSRYESLRQVSYTAISKLMTIRP